MKPKTPKKQATEKTYCIKCLKIIAKTTSALQVLIIILFINQN